MTAPASGGPPAAPGAEPPRRPVDPRRLTWLQTELAAWQADGLVTAAAADAIRDRYLPSRRLSLGRLLLGLGACLVGIGLIWLVAANLDAFSPAVRFAAVALLWLGLTAAAELLAGLRARRPDTVPAAVVGAAGVLAAASFGAVIFQAAQSLQVPAYTSGLVGFWGAGALLYAYAVGGVAPLLVGIATTTGWYLWVVGERADNATAVTTSVLLAGAAATVAAVAHALWWRPRFTPAWRDVGALLVLVGLFVAALPYAADDLDVSTPLVVGGAVTVVAAAAVASLAPATARIEPLAALAALAAGVVLVAWDPAGSTSTSALSGEGLARAVVSSAVFLAAAGWYAVLGTLRDARLLTYGATAAIVVFTTAQSFAVFAPILSGAALFLVIGAVLVGSGYLVSRGRRRLVADISGGAA